MKDEDDVNPSQKPKFLEPYWVLKKINVAPVYCKVSASIALWGRLGH